MCSIQKKINFKIYGKSGKPQLVFLHGLLGSLANWRSIIKNFEKDYHILAFDQRGHGKSFHGGPYEVAALAEDLFDLLKELSWGPVHLVGHSMGGRVALVFASKYPSLVDSLVIEDIGPTSTRESAHATIDLIHSIPTPFRDRESAKFFFANDFQRLWPDNPRILILGQFFFSNLVETHQKHWNWRFDCEGVIALLISYREEDLWEEFRAVTKRTLLVRGKASNELSHELFTATVSCNTNISGLEVDGAGHWVHFDKASEFAVALQDFLAIK